MRRIKLPSEADVDYAARLLKAPAECERRVIDAAYLALKLVPLARRARNELLGAYEALDDSKPSTKDIERRILALNEELFALLAQIEPEVHE